MPRIPYMSTPAAPGLYRQGNTCIARSASSLASKVFPIRLRRVYAYTFSLVPCFIAAGPPPQLRSTAGANACPHGAGRTPCLSRVPVSFSVSLTFFSHGFQIYGHRARTFPFIASRFRIVHAFAFSAQAFIFVFISGAFMHITIFNRFFFLSFFVFFRMYFHYCPVFFVPWRDSGRVGVNDEQQQQYTIRYHSPTSWTPCFYAFR